MMTRPTSIAYIDLLSVLFALFIITTVILMQNPSKPIAGNINQKAEIVAILEWGDAHTKSDVDIWIQDPQMNVLNYKTRSIGLLTLDHDDQGVAPTTIVDKDGYALDPHRQEVASIRGNIPGEYTINAVLYAKRDPAPIRAHVQVIKLNPYQVIADKEIDFTADSEEHTVVHFTLDSSGAVSDIDTTKEWKILQQ